VPVAAALPNHPRLVQMACMQTGVVYAVEFSHRSGRDLINMAKTRPNIVPIVEDARHPLKYRMLVGMVDTVFADVAQPDQVRSVCCLLSEQQLGRLLSRGHCHHPPAPPPLVNSFRGAGPHYRVEFALLPQERRPLRNFDQGELYRLDGTR
jgi:hypothetical protein